MAVLTGVGSVTQGNYLIQADAWNTTAAGFNGGATITTSGTATAPGFQVTADPENVHAPGAPGSYPSIVYGYGFAGPYTPNCQLPIQISALTPGLVVSTYSTTQVGGSAFDCSYDNWFAHSKTPTNQNAGLELMIWLNWGGGVTAGGPLHASNVTIGSNTYNIYYGTGNASLGTVYCLSTTPLTSITVDMYYFATYIVSQGWLANTDYLIGLEAGFETWRGNTGMTANSFSVTVGGGTNYAKTATLQDGFAGTTLNASLWSAVQTGTGSVVVNNGLSLTDTADSATYVAIKSNALYDLTSSQLVVELTSAGTQATDTQALLQVQDAAAQNALQLFVQDGNLVAQNELAGSYTSLATATYNATNMKWLRLREAAGTVYFEYAATLSGTYTTLYSYADPFSLAAVYVFVQQGSFGGADAVATSTWANLNTLLFTGAPSAGVTIGSSVTGTVGGISGSAMTGITITPSAIGAPGQNLIMALAPTAGTDPYGNSYPGGLYVTQATIEQVNSTGAVITRLDQNGNILIFNDEGALVIATMQALDATLIYADTGTATQGPLLVSIAGAAGTDQFSNPFPQGISVAGLSGATNVISVDDSSGNNLAGIDAGGNIVGQTLSAASDVIVGGMSLATFMATVNAYIGSAGTTSTFYPAQSWSYLESGAQHNHNQSMSQGYDPSYPGYGSQYSYMDFSAVASTITAGAMINWATLRLYCQGSYYSTGVTAGLYTASTVNDHATLSAIRDQWVISRGQVLTHTLVGQVLADVMAGSPYLVLGSNPWDTNSLEYSGYFYGAGGTVQYMPQLVVNWTPA